MQWYFHVDGKRIGPVEDAEAKKIARNHPDCLAWRQGFTEWVSVSRLAELAPNNPPPDFPPPVPRTVAADEIDYKVFGSEMQFVEIELDPGESVIAEAGAMMYKEPVVSMETIFGDGSAKSTQGGLFGKLMGAGKRLLTGESLFMTLFTHQGQGKAKAAFGAPYPGNIIPVHLPNVGGTLICQKDSFLCAAKGVSVGLYLQKKILTGLFGGEGFIMQKLEGDGLAFLHAGGTIVERQLQPGEMLHVDTGCIVAFEPSVQFDIQQAGGIKTALFGGEGLFFAMLTGPGKIWLQSLPFSRLAGRMLANATSVGSGKDEGSMLGGAILGGTMLGGLGGLLGGDDD